MVLRRGPDGDPEVALVHRPAYDDCEREEDAALREVQEETGMRCRLGRKLSSIRYRDRRGRPKVASYWVMTPDGGEFHPTAEVDEMRWLPLLEAEATLSYPHDRELLREALAED